MNANEVGLYRKKKARTRIALMLRSGLSLCLLQCVSSVFISFYRSRVSSCIGIRRHSHNHTYSCRTCLSRRVFR